MSHRSAYSANLALQQTANTPAYRYSVRRVPAKRVAVKPATTFTRAHALAFVGVVLVVLTAATLYL